MKTVDNILRGMRRLADETERGDCYDLRGLGTDSLRALADRIEAAHKREVAELRECLMEAVTEVCNRLEKCGFKEPCVFKTCYVQKWRKALQDKGGAE